VFEAILCRRIPGNRPNRCQIADCLPVAKN
jgi:hypothetical protein